MEQLVKRRIHLDVVDSTNSYVRNLISQGQSFPDITLIDADFQTAGRGQKGNSWESEPGKNLTFSLVCHPTRVLAARQFILSQAIALSICLTLSKLADGFSVKWPNDIYWNDWKVSGTLIECDLMGKYVNTCILGTGINVNQKDFSSDAPNPMSLCKILGTDIDKEALLKDIIQEFSRIYSLIQKGRDQFVKSEYELHLYHRTGWWPYIDDKGPFEAEFVGIEPTGHLLLRVLDGSVHRYEFKEVQFVLPV